MYGEACGAILADEMGLRKTVESLLAIVAKYSYGIQTHSTHPCNNPLPAIKDKKIGGLTPKMGVTWI
jgi:hypothetical protein